jgi:hypothetical protein
VAATWLNLLGICGGVVIVLYSPELNEIDITDQAFYVFRDEEGAFAMCFNYFLNKFVVYYVVGEL